MDDFLVQDLQISQPSLNSNLAHIILIKDAIVQSNFLG